MKKTLPNYFKEFIIELNTYTDLDKKKYLLNNKNQYKKTDLEVLKSDLKIAYKNLILSNNKKSLTK